MLNEPWIAELLVCGLLVWPLARILRRAGRSPAWAALIFLPTVGFFFLPILGFIAVIAVLALWRWPVQPPRQVPAPRKQRRAA